MERITSRKNSIIAAFKELSSDSAARREKGVYVCDGEKLLRDAKAAGAEIQTLLCVSAPPEGLTGAEESYLVPEELLRYVSPLKNSPGPLFTVKMRPKAREGKLKNAIVLENVQDPGNVGAVIRTAGALGIDRVILTGSCADPYNPKAVRAAMGALFRQDISETPLEGLGAVLSGLTLYGASLSPRARGIRDVSLKGCAVAVGSEGRGLSPELLCMCGGEIIIPMNPGSESLNAACAATIIMWEMSG